MLRKCFLWLMLLCLPLQALAAPTILVYGDSLSAAYGIAREQGWAALLQRRLTDEGYPHRVVNASVSGETTAGGLSRFDAEFKTAQPVIVILELGANDGLRGLPTTDMKHNLDAMIAAARQGHASVLLLGMRIPPNYGPQFTRQFASVYDALSRQYRLPLVPFFLDGVAGNRALVQEDGLHPTAAAQPRLLENIWPALKPLLGKPLSGAAKR
jgi:acyl-CoA thioesterase-1